MPRAHFPTEERDDGALSDGGDDMTPEQHGIIPALFRAFLLAQMSCPSRFQLKSKPASTTSALLLVQRSNPGLQIPSSEKPSGIATLTSKRQSNGYPVCLVLVLWQKD